MIGSVLLGTDFWLWYLSSPKNLLSVYAGPSKENRSEDNICWIAWISSIQLYKCIVTSVHFQWHAHYAPQPPSLELRFIPPPSTLQAPHWERQVEYFCELNKLSSCVCSEGVIDFIRIVLFVCFRLVFLLYSMFCHV